MRIYLLLIFILSFLTTTYSFSAPKILDAIIAVINDDILTVSDYKTKYQQLMLENPALISLPSKERKKKVIDELVLEHIQFQTAIRSGIRLDDIQFNELLRTIAKENNSTLDELKNKIESKGISWDDYQNNMRKQLVIQQAYRYLVAEQIEISNEEIKNYLQEYDKFQNNTKEYQVQELYISFGGKNDLETINQTKQKIQSIRDSITQGKDFDTVSSHYLKSSSPQTNPTTARWKKANELPIIFLNALVTMKAGEVSSPIRGDYGYFLIRLSAIRESEELSAFETQYHIRSITILKDQARTSETLQTFSNNIKKRLDAGEDFAALAIQYSKDSNSAGNGGDLGWISLPMLPAELADAVRKAPPNSYLGPIKTTYGFHIIQVLETKQVSKGDLYREATARDNLIKLRLSDEVERWQRSLLTSAVIELKQFDDQ
ncbi:MAG: peptidylprolyl isomerase [Methylacidiphilales bacterium]|nr:peptidylprolyl isomerase [Candidatus Methylacidiphilales bacterium]